MKRKSSIIIAIVFVAVLIVAVFAYNALRDRVPQDVNPAAPDAGQEITETPDKEPGASEDTTEAEKGDSETDMPLVPDFTITDADGKEISFSDFRGKPVVLNFWASWCPPCKQEMPEFEKVYQELGSEVQFVMLSLTDGSRETTETASSFIKNQGYTFPVFFDTNREGASLFGIQSIPTTFFISSDGYLVDYWIGMLDEAALRRTIENL